MLDDALIADNLEWLAQPPSALKNFREALSIFLSKDANKYRDLLDNLRFAVEQLLRDVLGNQKSLENQKDLLLPWMKKNGLQPQVINMYHDLLFKHFAIYQNDAVKHGEKYSLKEVEFMIYLTGTFMRLRILASRASN
jgi:dsDNA-binding SOS-regulon protein